MTCPRCALLEITPILWYNYKITNWPQAFEKNTFSDISTALHSPTSRTHCSIFANVKVIGLLSHSHPTRFSLFFTYSCNHINLKIIITTVKKGSFCLLQDLLDSNNNIFHSQSLVKNSSFIPQRDFTRILVCSGWGGFTSTIALHWKYPVIAHILP